MLWSDLPGYVVQSGSLDGGVTWDTAGCPCEGPGVGSTYLQIQVRPKTPTTP